MTESTSCAKADPKKPTDYTEGSVIGSIIKMGVPSMLGFITLNIYTLVDTWWVSRLSEGESAVAAITFFSAILMFLASFNQLIGPGSVAVISRRYGEKNYDLTEKAIKETLLLKVVFGSVFGGLGVFFAEDLLYLIGARGETLNLAVDYGAIMFLSMGLAFAMYSIFTALRGVANPQMSMILMAGSSLLNMALDPVLMFGWFGFPAMGIRGAAIASVIGFAVTLLVGLWLFYRGHTNVRLHIFGKESISVSSSITLIKIGLPAWVGSLSFSGSRLIIAPLIATFGTSVMAAYGVGLQITGFGIMLVVGMGLGLSTLLGHNLGSNKPERAKKTANQAIVLACGIMLALGVTSFFLAAPIMRLFFESATTVQYGVTMLRILSLAFPAIGLFIMVEQIHMGVGMNMPMMYFQIVHVWALQVIPVYIAVIFLGHGPETVWWLVTSSIVVTSIAMLIYFVQGRWLTVKV